MNNLAGAGPDHMAADLSQAAPELRWRAALLRGRPLDVAAGHHLLYDVSIIFLYLLLLL